MTKLLFRNSLNCKRKV